MDKKLLALGVTAVLSPLAIASHAQAASVQDIINQAVPVAKANNLYPSVAIAQGILESGGGTSYLASHYNNVFGVKWTYGQKASLMTKEVINGKWVDIVQDFQVYPSFTASFQAYARLLRNNPIYSGAWRENAPTYQHATAWLQGRYATILILKIRRLLRIHSKARLKNLMDLKKALTKSFATCLSLKTTPLFSNLTRQLTLLFVIFVCIMTFFCASKTRSRNLFSVIKISETIKIKN